MKSLVLFFSVLSVVPTIFASAGTLAEWQEVAFVGGSNVLLRGRQVADGQGGERTEFFHADGSPVPASFSAAHQRRWTTSSVATEGQPVPRSVAARRVPVFLRDRIAAASASVRLPAFDATAYRQADARRTDGPRARRIGAFRDLPSPLHVDGGALWIPTSDGGFVHVLEIASPGATAIRVAVDGAQIPDGVEYWVQDADNPQQQRGPYTRETIAKNVSGRFWTEAIWSDHVQLVCVVPAGIPTAGIAYDVKRIVHGYERFENLPKAAGLCHNDVSCYAAWSNEAAAVAGIANIGDDGFLFCTGCLIAQKDASDAESYFLTANHCVKNQTEADTTEYYWFYQTPTCRGLAPNPVDVPRSGGGADLLASASYYQANDFTFLRLRQPPASGTFRAGWSVTTPPTTEGLAGIHHPDGDYKRISFGNLYGYQSANFWNVRWSSGVTEPGSSGSPLFNASHQILGQLYGGNSYCAWQKGTDQYGRFDKTYPIVQKWLVPSAPLALMYFEVKRDYDGDGKADLAVYHAAATRWYLSRSLLGTTSFSFGYKGTMQVVGDFDGDHRTDPGVYDPNNGMWYWLGATGGMRSAQFGFKGTLPVPADYNGDGKTDLAVFDTAKAVWYIAASPTMRVVQFGFSGVIPVAADYDGDGRSDLGIFSPASGNWYLNGSAQGVTNITFGPAGSVPVPARYDGDTKTDLATYETSTGIWRIRGSSNGVSQRAFGGAGNIPVPGSYDGGPTANLATYKLSSGLWTILQGGTTQRVQFGWSDAPPVGVKP